jgi:hypothetical protein
VISRGEGDLRFIDLYIEQSVLISKRLFVGTTGLLVLQPIRASKKAIVKELVKKSKVTRRLSKV